MSNFIQFKNAVATRLAEMSKSNIFVVDVDKDVMWNVYLDSFPEGTNNIFKERREYDCNCCRGFIKNIGAAVIVNKDGSLGSIWDIEVEGYYQPVVEALSKFIKQHQILSPYFHYEKHIGVNRNRQLLENGQVKEWEHFYAATPTTCVLHKDTIASRVGDYRGTFDVLKRSMEEISLDAAEIVLELIDQNSLYRGEEHKNTVSLFVKTKKSYDKTKEKNNFLWEQVMKNGHQMRFRNTVIGTLLTDISDGKDLDVAVRSFEAKVAPSNYKRTTSLVTQGMIDQAKKKVQELGLQDSLCRRYAKKEDITINNVLFADRSIKKALDVFDELNPTKKKEYKKVEEVSIEKFLKDILPTTESVEVLFENKQKNNLVSLVAPVYTESTLLFKWDNNFSWSYNGEVTDSIKERVKAAGGEVDGDVRVSLSWFNLDDLDLSVVEPNGYKIYFGDRHSPRTGGQLDVDMNAWGKSSRTPVENIFWKNMDKMTEGRYKVYVHNYNKRETKDVGFELEIEAKGQIFNLAHPKDLRDGDRVLFTEFEYSKKGGIQFVGSVTASSRQEEIWGLTTGTFHKVSMIMNSPNHWDGNESGNKHLFFMMDGCVNPEKTRGFYNEFLRNELTPHRKVFEVLGSKMKTEESGEQLSGLGFSSTKRDQVTVKVVGKTSRILQINF